MKSIILPASRLKFAKLELPIIAIAFFATNALSFMQASRHKFPYHFDLFDSPSIAGLLAGLVICILVRTIHTNNSRQKSYPLLLVESLATALDERDKYTSGHARRVTNLALQLVDQMADKSIDRELLRLSCILHDIGKIGISDTVLLKPGKLTQLEFDEIKKHPDQGAHILQPVASKDPRFKAISHIIRHHHERYDGNGYPNGLKTDTIPLLARIIALADSFDAMTSDRPYRKGMACETALEIITENSGTQFDPTLAATFVAMLTTCREAGPCPGRDQCNIFVKIANHQISKAYESQYCVNNFHSCARYKIPNKEIRQSNLLPDGSFLF